MPVVTYKNKTYVLRWKKEWDEIILQVGKKYKKGKIVDWKQALKKGEFKTFPLKLTLGRNISHRLTHLKNRSSEEYKRVRLDYYYAHKDRINKKRRETGSVSYLSKYGVFKVSPNSLKEKHGWKSRQIWSVKQQGVLIALTKEHRKSKKTVDWEEV